MAKLVDVYRTEKQPSMNRRQLPLIIDENLTVNIVLYLVYISNRKEFKLFNFNILYGL